MNSSSPSRPALATTRRGPFSQTTDCVTATGGPGAAVSASGTPQGQHGVPGSAAGPATPATSGGATTPTYSDIEHAALTGCLQEMFHGAARMAPGGRIVGGGHVTGVTSRGGSVITTSIDEGVELDSDLCSTASLCSNVSAGQATSGTTHHAPTDSHAMSGRTGAVSHAASTASAASAAGSTTSGSVGGPVASGSSLPSSHSICSQQSISTGIGSPFMSFDSNVEADLVSSLSSCNVAGQHPGTGDGGDAAAGNGAGDHSSSSSLGKPAAKFYLPATAAIGPSRPGVFIGATMTPPFCSKFVHGVARASAAAAGCGNGTSGGLLGVGTSCTAASSTSTTGADVGAGGGGGLRETRSPVSFREGRRASDGVMLARHGVVIAFRQRLRDTTKTRGVAELARGATAHPSGDDPSSSSNSSSNACELGRLDRFKRDLSNKMRQWSLDDGTPSDGQAAPTSSDSRTPKLAKKRRNYPTSAESPDDEEPHKIGGMSGTVTGVSQRGGHSGPFAVIQTRLHRLLQTSSKNSYQQPTLPASAAVLSSASSSAIQPASSSVGCPASELHPIHQQMQQLHIGCGGAGGSAVGMPPATTASVETTGDAAAVNSPAAAPLYHSTVVPPRLMRRHFVRQSSYKTSAPPLSATGGMMSFDEDFESSLMSSSSSPTSSSVSPMTCGASVLLTSSVMSTSASSTMCGDLLISGGQQLSPTFEEDEQQCAVMTASAGSKCDIAE